MSCKHVTVKSSSKTNSTESVTNGLQQNKERCHRPGRSARLEQTYKFISLAFYSKESNSTLQSNTHTESKPRLSCDSRAERYQPKGVTSLNNKEKDAKPSYCNFALIFRKNPPSRWQTVGLTTIYRTGTLLTPLQMYTFQSLSVPKTTHRFAKTRECTISCLCFRMVIRMITNQYLQYNSTTNSPNINTKHRSHKRLMQGYQWNTSPSLSSRCKKDRKIDIHNCIFYLNVLTLLLFLIVIYSLVYFIVIKKKI